MPDPHPIVPLEGVVGLQPNVYDICKTPTPLFHWRALVVFSQTFTIYVRPPPHCSTRGRWRSSAKRLRYMPDPHPIVPLEDVGGLQPNVYDICQTPTPLFHWRALLVFSQTFTIYARPPPHCSTGGRCWSSAKRLRYMQDPHPIVPLEGVVGLQPNVYDICKTPTPLFHWRALLVFSQTFTIYARPPPHCSTGGRCWSSAKRLRYMPDPHPIVPLEGVVGLQPNVYDICQTPTPLFHWRALEVFSQTFTIYVRPPPHCSTRGRWRSSAKRLRYMPDPHPIVPLEGVGGLQPNVYDICKTPTPLFHWRALLVFSQTFTIYARPPPHCSTGGRCWSSAKRLRYMPDPHPIVPLEGVVGLQPNVYDICQTPTPLFHWRALEVFSQTFTIYVRPPPHCSTGGRCWSSAKRLRYMPDPHPIVPLEGVGGLQPNVYDICKTPTPLFH